MTIPSFIQETWKTLWLTTYFKGTELLFETPDRLRESSIQQLQALPIRTSVSRVSRSPNLTVSGSKSERVITYRPEFNPSISSRSSTDILDGFGRLDWFSSNEVRFSARDDNNGLTLITGTEEAFNRVRREIQQTENGYLYRGETYAAISLGLFNESLAFNREGDDFRSVSRRQARRLGDEGRVLIREQELSLNGEPSGYRAELIRSFQLNRSRAARRWLGDDLYVTDSRISSSGSTEGTLRQSFVFTGSGLKLSKTAVQTARTNPAATEISQISFDADAFPRQLRDEFRAALHATRRAERTAPAFAGYSGANLGFDWLTNIPDQAARGNLTARDILSETGPSISSFNQNQIFLALGAVDILTGRGRDLVVLADDVDNNAVNTVPRIHDFDPERDRIFIPQDIFSGLDGDAPGALAARRFWAGRQANRRSQRLIYDSRNGLLYHDPDGNRRANQQLIAAFLNTPELTAENVLIG